MTVIFLLVISGKFVLFRKYSLSAILDLSGVARAFPGGRLAHPEGQNEEENE